MEKNSQNKDKTQNQIQERIEKEIEKKTKLAKSSNNKSREKGLHEKTCDSDLVKDII